MSLTEPTFRDDVENLITEDSADVSQSGGTASSPFSSIHFLQVYKVGGGPARWVALNWIAGFISIYSSSQFGWSDLWEWEQNQNSQLKHESPHQYSPWQQQRVLGPKRWSVYSVALSPPMVWWCWVFVLVCNPLAVCHTVHVSPCRSATRLHVHEGRGGWWCTEPRWWMSAKETHTYTNRMKKQDDVTHSTSQCSNSLSLMQSVHMDNISSIIRHLVSRWVQWV